MAKSSKEKFRIAYFMDTFPQRTENFLLREIAGVLEFWPDLRVYCFHLEDKNWQVVDHQPEVRSVPAESIALPLSRMATIHLSCLMHRPRQYFSAMRQALRLHNILDLRALRRFDQAVRLADRAAKDRMTHLHACFANEPAIVCHLASRIIEIPYSVSAHAYDIWATKPRGPVLEQATCCIACTAHGRDYLTRQFPKAKVGLVYHGFISRHDPAQESQRDASRPKPPPLRIVTAGRLITKKGFDTLIDACALLVHQGVDLHCMIFGDGELRDSLRRQIASLDLIHRVSLHPFVPHDHLREHLSSAHICALPCRIDPTSGDRDGIPNILLEAIDCGTVVVTSNLPALRELIAHRATGFLVQSNDPTNLANAIREASQAEPDWPGIREESRSHLEQRFALEENCARFRKLIETSSLNAQKKVPTNVFVKETRSGDATR